MAHHNGKAKSATIPRIVNRVQKILRCIYLFYLAYALCARLEFPLTFQSGTI
jgi:hypothetical protein